MVLMWAQSAPSNDSNCGPLDAFNAARPPEPPALVAVSAALFAAFSVLSVATLGAWWGLRGEHRLQFRPFALACATTGAVWLAYVVVALKRAMIVAESGHSTMSCWVFAILYIAICPLLAGSNIVQLLVRVNHIRKQRNAVVFDQPDGEELSQTTTGSTPLSQAGRNTVAYFLSVFRFSIGRVEDATTAADAERKLLLIRDSVSNGALLFFFSILFGFAGMLVALSLGTTAAYRSNCSNCDLTYELIMVLFICIVVTLPLRLQLFRTLVWYMPQDSPDHFLYEMRIYAPCVALSVIITTILLAVDPSQADYLYIFPWEYILLLGLTIYWFLNVFRHVFAASRERKVRLSILATDNLSSNHYLAGGVLRFLDNDTIIRSFEAFCASRFTLENVKFIKECHAFVEFYDERSPTWRAKKASDIVRNFVRQGGILQVNLSSANRTKVEAVFSESEASGKPIPKTAFDEAYKEIVRLVNNNTWFEFAMATHLADPFSGGKLSAPSSAVSGMASKSMRLDKNSTPAIAVVSPADSV